MHGRYVLTERAVSGFSRFAGTLAVLALRRNEPAKRDGTGTAACAYSNCTGRFENGNFEDLTAEQKEKAIACKTAEELLALAKEEGFELTEAQLDSVAGGWNTPCRDDSAWTYAC